MPCRNEVRAPLRVSSSALSASEGSTGIIGAWDSPRQPHLSRRSLPPGGQKTQVKGETDKAHDVMKTPQDKTFRPARPLNRSIHHMGVSEGWSELSPPGKVW